MSQTCIKSRQPSKVALHRDPGALKTRIARGQCGSLSWPQAWSRTRSSRGAARKGPSLNLRLLAGQLPCGSPRSWGRSREGRGHGRDRKRSLGSGLMVFGERDRTGPRGGRFLCSQTAFHLAPRQLLAEAPRASADRAKPITDRLAFWRADTQVTSACVRDTFLS